MSSSNKGHVPNIYVGAPLIEQLRDGAYYEYTNGKKLHTLPDVKSGTVLTHSCMVREDTDLWNHLHDYALTSGSVASILGLWEKNSARKLGVHTKSASHRKMIAACLRMDKVRGNRDFLKMKMKNVPPSMLRSHEPFAKALAYENAYERVRKQMERHSKSVSRGGVMSVNMAWGSIQEHTAQLNILKDVLRPEDELCEIGLCLRRAEDLDSRFSFGQHDLPLLGGTPDAMLVRKNSQTEVQSDRIYSPLLKSWLDTMGQKMQHCIGPEDLYVVEIKNPAAFNQIATRRGKTMYAFKDPETHCKIYPSHIAQIQLQILVTGVKAAFLVSNTPCAGLNVFQIPEDVSYQQQMLQIISRIHKKFLRKGKIPPENIFSREESYQNFLQDTKHLANTIRPLFSVQKSTQVRTYSNEMFWG